MGVLEAWKDAEKVGFPIVGEEKKAPSNVVDYDIHQEITKDTSNVVNANNQTTTGMATVIPGINAPKLIADTSIVGIPEQEGSYYGTLVASSFTGTITVPPGNTPKYPSKDTTISSNSFPFTWQIDGRGLVFPKSGGYQIVVRFYTMGQSEFTRNDTVYIGNTAIGTYSGWQGTDLTFQVNANKGETLRFETYISNSFPSTTVTKNPGVRYTITMK